MIARFFLLALIALRPLSAMAGCTCVPDCGAVSQPCCDCTMLPGDDKCIFNDATKWCMDNASCGATNVCLEDDVVDSSSRGCGDVNERCCERGWCAPGLLCGSGSCVDPNSVVDSAPCGLMDSPCCGYYEDCDEDLACDAGVCISSAP